MSDVTEHQTKIVQQFTRWAKPFAELPIHAEADGMARTLAALELDPEHRVLDVACGPGIVACAIAEHVAHVTGVDLTPAMLEQARARQAGLGLSNMDWREGDATRLPFHDGGFDRVATRYSFHHIPGPGAALAEMVRVCRPGGRVVVIDATPSAETQRAYDEMETLRDPSHASAQTLEQLRGLGQALKLEEQRIDRYRLEARLDTLSDQEDMAALTALFEADIASGRDEIGVGAWRAEDGIRFFFPISIVAWRTPG
jgi:ubiquinone/menaquinone biosynthesis C-methylase UbiE